jgi:2-keto-4-pentenoate hydratase/2-oxohepta-3-ene-1,7-dioic acid hydratase in catechol pathway
MQFGRTVLDGLDGPEPRIVVAHGRDRESWVDVRSAERLRLERTGATVEAAHRLALALVPGSLAAAIGAGPAFLEAARLAQESDDETARVSKDVSLLAPLDPVAYRDFMAFEQHFVQAGRRLGYADPAEVLYELPVSYFGNAHAILGPEAVVPWPHYSTRMDFELELGIVIGRGGRDLRPETALDHVLGLTVFNDFTARDMQAREMAGGLGPSKSKHFASSLGPRIVTLDELGDDLAMTAHVNGELWARTSSGTIMWSLSELVSWASAAEPLVAGTLLGTGTAGGGCGLELDRFLEPGDVVELEIEGIGVLRNRLGQPPASGWMPDRKQRTVV